MSEAEPDRAALLRRWLELTRHVLPGMAASQRWPIRYDHCFMRVCLDVACGEPWTRAVPPPAIRNLSDGQLALAVAVAERVVASPDSLAALNGQSLRWRRASRAVSPISPAPVALHAAARPADTKTGLRRWLLEREAGMTEIAKKTDEKLWTKVKAKVTKGDKGGHPGQWSARKAQLATSEYKSEGGGYEGGKTQDNHLQQWTKEDWGTASGKESLETGERYLPREARDKLTPAEYKRTSAKKKRDMHHGAQHSAQPEDVARKVADTRDKGASAKGQGPKGPSRARLYEEAKERDIPGRSRMSRAELEQALRS